MSGQTCEDCGTELGYVEEGAKLCDRCDGYRDGQRHANARLQELAQLHESGNESYRRLAAEHQREQRRAEAAEAEVAALKAQYLAPLYPLVAADRIVMVVERMAQDKLGLVRDVGQKLLPLARHALAERRRMAELLTKSAVGDQTREDA